METGMTMMLAGGRTLSVRHVPTGAVRTSPREHYYVSVGAGVAELRPSELDDLIDGLQRLRARVAAARDQAEVMSDA